MESQKYLNDDGNMDFSLYVEWWDDDDRKKKGKGHFVLENMGRDGTGWDGIYMVSTGEHGRLLSKKKKKKKKGM